MKDVARIAGVSVATVSRVLNDKDGTIPISRETRDRVLAVVDQVGYKPNYAAQRLRSSKLDHSIGVYIPWGWELGGFASFTGRLLESISKSVHGMPYSITLIYYHPGKISTHYEELQRVRAHRIDGMLIMGASPGDIEFLDSVSGEKHPPFIAVHREIRHGNFVTSKNREGAAKMVSSLLDQEHRKIAFISTPKTHGRFRDYIYTRRYEGFMEGYSRRGMVPDESLLHFTRKDDPETVKNILEKIMQKHSPTAVFTTRDSLAVSVIRSLPGLGLKVPDDLTLVTFTDNPEAIRLIEPEISCIVVPIEEMGSHAVSRLAEMLGTDKKLQPFQEFLDCPIVG
ncbi:MAG: LacI family DNA-binding transcriptional regulator [Spirochaetia bacterium]